MMNEEKWLKGVQDWEIDILQQVHKICKKYKLKYFAIGGTALGAVRHEGFIPWDDDIDIGMPRKDYEKFLSVVQKELPEGYHVQNFFTEPATPFYFTKIRKDGTKFVEYYLKDYPIHQGIFVDIFPFDGIPDDSILAKVHFRVCRILYQLYLCKSLDTVCSSRMEQLGETPALYKRMIRKGLHICLKPVPKKWLFNLLDYCVQIFNGTKTKRIGHIVRRRLAVDKDVLYPITWLKFEHIQMPVPKDYDTYLKNQFGDYMKLPAEDKRYGHLPYQVEIEDGGAI